MAQVALEVDPGGDFDRLDDRLGDTVAAAGAARDKNMTASRGDVEGEVYAKAAFAGPEAVLAYLSRYNHHVAIANSRLFANGAGTENLARAQIGAPQSCHRDTYFSSCRPKRRGRSSRLMN